MQPASHLSIANTAPASVARVKIMPDSRRNRDAFYCNDAVAAHLAANE